MTNSLLILGMGGYGAVVRECAQALSCFDRIEFLDDIKAEALGVLNTYESHCKSFTHAYPALGKNTLRVQWIDKLMQAGYQIPTLIHPSAYVSPSAQLANGVCVLANATVCANAQLARGVIINAASVADHNCVINEGVHLAPGAVVKAGRIVERFAKIESGEVVFQ